MGDLRGRLAPAHPEISAYDDRQLHPPIMHIWPVWGRADGQLAHDRREGGGGEGGPGATKPNRIRQNGVSPTYPEEHACPNTPATPSPKNARRCAPPSAPCSTAPPPRTISAA